MLIPIMTADRFIPKISAENTHLPNRVKDHRKSSKGARTGKPKYNEAA